MHAIRSKTVVTPIINKFHPFYHSNKERHKYLISDFKKKIFLEDFYHKTIQYSC